MKKWLALQLVLALGLPAVGAFAEEAPEIPRADAPIVEEVVHYSLMVPRTASQGDWNEMWIFDHIEETLGIRFDVQMIDSTGWTERLNLAFATDDLPDVFWNGLTDSDLATYGAQGYLIDMSELIEQYAPTIQNLLDTYPSLRRSILSPDGAIYSLPSIVMEEREKGRMRIYMNTQWLKNLGLEMPATLDELYDVLLAFKEKDPNGNGEADEIPVSARFEDHQLRMLMLAAFGYADARWDVVDDKVLYVPAQENYYHYLEYMKRLFSEGLLDVEYFSQTADQYSAKTASVLCGMFVSNGANWVNIPQEEGYAQYSMFEPFTSAYNDEKIWPATEFSLANMFAITEEAENPEYLIRFADWCYTLEGSIAMRYGLENGTWEGGVGGYEWAKMDNGEFAMVTYYDDTQFDNYNDFRTRVITPMQGMYLSGEPNQLAGTGINETYFTALDPRQVMLTNDILDHGQAYYDLSFPAAKITDAESAQISLLDTDIESYVQQMEAKFITGDEELTQENFDAYVTGLFDRGLQDYIDLKQSIYDRWLAG